MQGSDNVLERCRAQADKMLAVAAKTPLPTIYVTVLEAMAVAHGLQASARQNASPDVPDQLETVRKRSRQI
jgi:hypothetical protein